MIFSARFLPSCRLMHPMVAITTVASLFKSTHVGGLTCCSTLQPATKSFSHCHVMLDDCSMQILPVWECAVDSWEVPQMMSPGLKASAAPHT